MLQEVTRPAGILAQCATLATPPARHVTAAGELSPALAAAVWVHSEPLRSWQAEDGPLVNLFPVGAIDVAPEVWMLPLWFLLASDPLVPRDTLPA